MDTNETHAEEEIMIIHPNLPKERTASGMLFEVFLANRDKERNMKTKGPVERFLDSIGMDRFPPSGKTKATVQSITLFVTGERRPGFPQRERKMYSETEEEANVWRIAEAD